MNIPDFNIGALKSPEGSKPDVLDIERDFVDLPHLKQDRKTIVRLQRRTTRNALQAAHARDLIERLPEQDEAMHLVVGGRFSLFDLIPAALALAEPLTLDELHVATLGFSKDNVTSLARLIDAKKVGRLTLLCSHYFAGTSPDIHSMARVQLAEERGQTFISIRTHCKLLALKFTDGRTLTVESSANLRSCKNIEQMTLVGSPELYTFHTAWIDDLAREQEDQV